MAAQVNVIRAELLKVREEAKQMQDAYQQNAEQRIAYQNKMAQLNQMVQERCPRDAMLVEDVIIVTLVAEKAAQDRYLTVPLKPPPPTKAGIVGGTTKSAEEAIEIYKSQIEALKKEIDYRTQLNAAEEDMDVIYRQAVDDILNVLDDFCSDSKVHRELEAFAMGGEAPGSPRKSKTKKGMVSRLLAAPKSPVRGMFTSTTADTVESPSASMSTTDRALNEYMESPSKVAFSEMKNKKPSALDIGAPPLMDDDDENDDVAFIVGCEGGTNEKGGAGNKDNTTNDAEENSDEEGHAVSDDESDAPGEDNEETDVENIEEQPPSDTLNNTINTGRGEEPVAMVEDERGDIERALTDIEDAEGEKNNTDNAKELPLSACKEAREQDDGSDLHVLPPTKPKKKRKSKKLDVNVAQEDDKRETVDPSRTERKAKEEDGARKVVLDNHGDAPPSVETANKPKKRRKSKKLEKSDAVEVETVREVENSDTPIKKKKGKKKSRDGIGAISDDNDHTTAPEKKKKSSKQKTSEDLAEAGAPAASDVAAVVRKKKKKPKPSSLNDASEKVTKKKKKKVKKIEE